MVIQSHCDYSHFVIIQSDDVWTKKLPIHECEVGRVWRELSDQLCWKVRAKMVMVYPAPLPMHWLVYVKPFVGGLLSQDGVRVCLPPEAGIEALHAAGHDKYSGHDDGNKDGRLVHRIRDGPEGSSVLLHVCILFRRPRFKCTPTPPLPPPYTPTPTHTHTNTRTDSLSLWSVCLSVSLSASLSLSLSLSLTLTHTLSLSLSHTHTHTQART